MKPCNCVESGAGGWVGVYVCVCVRKVQRGKSWWNVKGECYREEVKGKAVLLEVEGDGTARMSAGESIRSLNC